MTTSPLEYTSPTEDMGATCATCAGKSFRRSRLQWKDVSALMLLHYPVRCLSCSKRQTVGLTVARRAVPSTVKQVRAPHDGTPWSAPASAVVPSLQAASDSSVGTLQPPRHPPITMPDLHGVRLPHIAYVPPGDGENLAS